MSLTEPTFSKLTQFFRARSIAFLAEHDGEPERELKSALTQVLQTRRNVSNAYLARVRYGNSGEIGVAVCLRTVSGVDHELVGELGKVFKNMFRSQEHMDIIFLEQNQEGELAKCCRPFFEKNHSAPL
jgi:hypothetical protein